MDKEADMLQQAHIPFPQKRMRARVSGWLLVLVAVMGLSTLTNGSAQTNYPSRVVKIIVAVAPGGGTDLVARAIAKALSEQLERTFIVENHPGGGSILGSELVAKAAPDGYTLFVATSALSLQPAFEKKLPYDPLKSFAPIAILGDVPLVLVASVQQQAKTIEEWLALAQRKPGATSFGWSDQSTYMAFEMLRLRTKTEINNIPYKGTSMLLGDVSGGHLDSGFVSPGTALQLVNSGKMLALAVTGSTRSTMYPHTKTISESISPGYEATVWYGMLAPAGTPLPIREKLNDEVRKALASEDVKKVFANLGAEPGNMSVQDFERFYTASIAKWLAVVNTEGMRMPRVE